MIVDIPYYPTIMYLSTAICVSNTYLVKLWLFDNNVFHCADGVCCIVLFYVHCLKSIKSKLKRKMYSFH